MKYLWLSLLLVGCTRSYGIKVGMTVTNGFCAGQVSEIYKYNEQAHIPNAVCGKISYNYVDLPLSDLKEVE